MWSALIFSDIMGTFKAGDRRIMVKRSKHSYIKFQKELKRKKKAEEKLAKRQGKKDKTIDADEA